MIQTSEAFITEINKYSRKFTARLLHNGGVVDGDIKSITIRKGACGSSFSIGSLFSSYIDAVISGTTTELENKEIKLQIGLVLPNQSVEYVDMGYYTVTKPKKTAHQTSFTGYGRIVSRLNGNLPECGNTLQNILDAITTKTGVLISLKGLTAVGNLNTPVTGLTCRKALELVTTLLGGFATEDNGGGIVISKFMSDGNYPVGGDRMLEFPEFNEYDYELTGVKVVVSEDGEDNEGIFYTSGTDIRQELTNTYMTEEIFTAFASNLVGYTYRPGTVQISLGDPRLEPWDVLLVTDIKGDVYKVPCLDITHTFDGGFITSVTAPGDSKTEEETQIKGPLSQRIDELDKKASDTALKADNAQSAADAAQSAADEAAESASQANSLAATAQASADQAKQSADAAKTAADNAQSAVDAVEADVTALETSVNNAQTAADNAQKAADAAKTAADTAQQSADNAAAEAETAKTNAATAQTKAEEAAGSAASAQETAEDAVTKANAAQTTASAARAEITQANKEIDDLSTTLDTTKKTLEADYSKKTELSEAKANLQAQITENAAQIELTHTKIVEVDETANDARDTAQAAQTAAGKAQSDAAAAKTAADNAQAAADAAKTAADTAQTDADTAKTAAANAKSVADKAQMDLEAAQADLATVSGRVDATEEDIAAAQEAVTTAQAAADKAKQDAAAAQLKAETAQSAADDAATKATAAQTKADEAKTAADDAALVASGAQTDAAAAKTAAANAQKAAETAQSTATAAKTSAANAQTKADQAAADAAAAQTTADAAKTKAETAQSDLTKAKENLETVKSRVDATEEDIAAAELAVQAAQSKADEAAASAASAQSTADQAAADAATAQTAANNAKADAATAQTAANNAKAAADAAQEAVDALKTRVTKTETDIKKNADAIALTATKEEVTETLGGYYTKEESDAAIEVKAGSIKQEVSSTYATKQGLEDANTQIETNKSQIEQTAKQLKLLIKSGDTESSLVLTDKLIELAAAGINLKGLVSFSGLDTEAQGKITDAQSTADNAQETANSAAAKSDLISGIVNGADTFDISAAGSLSEESAQIDAQEASGKFTIPGEYVFSFTDSSWKLDGSDVALSDYGITLTETPAAGDTITVIYDDSGLVDAIDELNKRADEMSSDVDLLGDTTSNLQEWTGVLSEATSKLQAVQETTSKEMDSLSEELKGYRGCVVIDGDEPSITIGAGSDAQTNLKITSEKMSFMNNGNEAASLSNDTLKADSAEITNLYMRSVDDNGIVVGTLGWIARANGHLSLKVIG